jgi:ketosteroid isomerase-like protein
MSSQNVETVRRSFEAWNRDDVDAWLEGAHPEIEWSSEVVRRIEGAETVYRGTDGMRRYWDEWHAVWDMTIEVTDARELDGDTVLAFAQLHSRGRGSGVDVDQPVAYVIEFDDGLARRVRAYLDPQQAIEATGRAGD